MEIERWQRIEQVYNSVFEAPPHRRCALLDEACSSDPDLRREVESLLSACDKAQGFLSHQELKEHIGLLSRDQAVEVVGSSVGRYHVLSFLGAGAMAEVYLARDTSLERQVALKLLPHRFTQEGERVVRFVREAKAASLLNHPNIITIYEIGQAGETWFIAAEFIEGATLRERLASSKLTLEQSLDIAIQCAAALETAHRTGIVHRDVKPENIMIRPDGLVKVLAFGLARVSEGQQAVAATETQKGLIMGTPRYMSPEQARGQKLDERTDIFSLGSVIYEMVAGRPAFPGQTTADVFAALLAPLPPLPGGTPEAIERIVTKALEKERESRFQSMAELARALADCREMLQAGMALPQTQARRASSKMARRFLLAGAILIVFIAALIGYIRIPRRDVPADANLKFTPLTTFAGSKIYPALSPDGSVIAFSWRSSDKDSYHIYVKPVPNGDAVQLTFGSEEDSFPAWSPYGRQIAFCRRMPSPDERARLAYGIFVVPASGGAVRKITDAWAGVSWSPDGKTLAIARVPADAPDSGGIDLVSVESGTRHKLTGSRDDRLPAFSPDGKWIAFIRVLPGRGRARDIFVVSPAGAQLRRLTFDAVYVTGLTWTADSREIVFSSPRNPTEGSFWRIPVTGGNPRPLSTALRHASFPSTSRTGGRMVYAESWTDSNLHLRAGPGLPREGMTWRFEDPVGVVLSSGAEHTPAFSPDGEHFAFVSDRTGNNEIWVARRDGTEPVQLTSFGTKPAGSPRWSPDGAWIAFDVWASAESNVYVVDSRGGPTRRFSSEPGESWVPAWSHDGSWIYFTSGRSGTSEIWKAPVAGGTAVMVTHGGAYEALPSEDGSAVYFRKSTPAGCCAIWFVPTGGGPEQPVRELEKFATISRSWGVLKDGIYFVARENEPRQKVRFLNFATREVAEMIRLEQEPYWSFVGLALSPDGRYLLNTQIDRETNDLIMIENFR